MDWELAPTIEKVLIDCNFDRNIIKEEIKKHLVQNIAEDIAKMFEENI